MQEQSSESIANALPNALPNATPATEPGTVPGTDPGTVPDIGTSSLPDSPELLRALVHAAPSAIIALDTALRVWLWNEAAERMFGYTAAEVIGQPLPTALVDDESSFHTIQERYVHGEALRDLEVVRFRKDGTRIDVSLSTAPLRNADGEVAGSIGMMVDLTNRKAAEAEVRRLNRELEQRVRERTAQLEASNRELESFAYSVSHDLRAPLRSIDGFTAQLEREYINKLDATAQHYMARVRTSVQRMGALIDGLLTLSRLTRRELRPAAVDLSALAAEIIAGLRLLEPARAVTATIAPGLTSCGDPELLRAVLENLLGNAWKFTGPNPAAHIEFGAQPAGDELVYFVADNGVGFDMAYADQLFGPFQRLHRDVEFPGSGIGLATVQRILARHGGRIWVDAAEGKGATFYFTVALQPT